MGDGGRKSKDNRGRRRKVARGGARSGDGARECAPYRAGSRSRGGTRRWRGEPFAAYGGHCGLRGRRMVRRALRASRLTSLGRGCRDPGQETRRQPGRDTWLGLALRTHRRGSLRVIARTSEMNPATGLARRRVYHAALYPPSSMRRGRNRCCRYGVSGYPDRTGHSRSWSSRRSSDARAMVRAVDA